MIVIMNVNLDLYAVLFPKLEKYYMNVYQDSHSHSTSLAFAIVRLVDLKIHLLLKQKQEVFS